MKSNDLYLGAYWGARKENVQQCSERLLQCLSELTAIDGALSSWYYKEQSRQDATLWQDELFRPLHMWPRESICQLLEKGRNRRDFDKTIIEDLGFSICLWNWCDLHQATSPLHPSKFSVTCGLCSSNPKLSNAVVLDFPEALEPFNYKGYFVDILTIVAKAWEPEWAGVISRTSRTFRKWQGGSPFVDWMFYINRTNVEHTKLPSSASAIEINRLGTVLITQEQPINPSNPIDMENIKMVETAVGL